MATEAALISAVRLHLGDSLETFRDSFRGNGSQDDYTLPARNVTDVEVFIVGGDDAIITLVEDVDFTLDRAQGIITFTEPTEVDAQYVVEGTAHGIFTDEEILHFLRTAAGVHLKDRTIQTRYRDGHGFIQYDIKPMGMEDVPVEEEGLVALLATIEALWALSTDAATDIDVTTSEGTHIPRGQRWRQLISQIDILEEKYKRISMAMGVGLDAPAVFDMRRVSRTTGRLVPVFVPREYDEHGPPIRKIPPRGDRDADPDGPANPYWSGGWGF